MFATKPGDTLKVERYSGGIFKDLTLNGSSVTQATKDSFESTQIDNDEFYDRVAQEIIDSSYSDYYYYYDRIETRKNGITLHGLAGRSAILFLTAGQPLGSSTLSTEIGRGLFVEPTTEGAQIDFSALKNTKQPFSQLETVSVRASRYAEVEFSNNGNLNFMRSLRSIEVVATGPNGITARVGLSASAENNDPAAGDGSGFMDRLESIRIVGTDAAATMSISHSGSDNFMKSLRTITMEASGENNSADLSISASTNSFGNNRELAGSSFMPSLQSIKLISTQGESSLSVSYEGSKDFMRSLKTISVEAFDTAQISISASSKKLEQGIFNSGHNFMTSLQSIKLISRADYASLSISQKGGNDFMKSLRTMEVQALERADISISASIRRSRDGDMSLSGSNFMASLQSITILSKIETATLSVSAAGGISFMKSLKTIQLTGAINAEVSISASVNFTGGLGYDFMSSLEKISVSSLGNASSAFRRASVSVSNEGGDLFMKSLQKIEATSQYARAAVNIDNRAEEDDDRVLKGHDFMKNLTSIKAFSPTISDVDIDNEGGLSFMESLSLIEVSGRYSHIGLKGLFSNSPTVVAPGGNNASFSRSITIDTKRVGGEKDSLAFIHTHDFQTDSPYNRPLIVLIGSSNVQYNAVYETNEWTNLDRKSSFDLFTFNELFANDTVRSYKGENFPIINQFSNNDALTGFYTSGFAGINVGAQAVGWSALGSNGVQDILKFTSYDSGNVVVGGFDNGLDRFDFSALRDVITGQVIDQTNSDSHAATQRGGILVTKINTNDAMMWINSGGGTTNVFEDFESWVYVVGGANMTWNSSDFIF